MDERSWFSRVLFYDWPRRLTALLILIFILQFVSWFGAEEGFWWPETVTLVQIGLAACFALELLPVASRSIVRCLQLLMLLGINAVYSGYKLILFPVRSLKAFGELIYENVWQLHPFLWFSLGAWAVYVTAVWCAGVKWRAVALTVTAVLVLSIRDSFSTLTLWDETLIVLLCGLLIMVVRQFGNLKHKSPASWSYLGEYPGTPILTVLLLIGIMFIPAFFFPTVRPLVTDPYTAYMHWRGQEVPSLGKAIFGDLGFGSGSSTSGYSRDDSSLGGGFDFDYSPVLYVETTHRSYWRGETLSLYTGEGWERSDSDKKASSGPVRLGGEFPPDPRFDQSRRKTIEVKQTVSVLSEESYPILFGAYPISRLVTINGGDAVPTALSWSPQQSELRWKESNNAAYPKSYEIISQIPIVDESELKLAPANPPNANQFGEYLQLPRGLPERVAKLGAEITAGAATGYEKAKLLERYLQLNYKYTSQPQTELGTSGDFVDQFLFEIQEGYCDYYSTAMAVLARTIGIPSRWVKGYTSGIEQYREEIYRYGYMPGFMEETDPNGAGLYTVRNADAHSWVELYFHGYGWIPFEPTSGFVLPVFQGEKEPVAYELPELPASAPVVVAPVDNKGIGFEVWLKVILWTGAAVVLCVGIWIYRNRLILLLPHKGLFLSRRDEGNWNYKVVQEYTRLVRYYRRKGYPVYDHETARETVERLKLARTETSNEWQKLLDLFEKAKYSSTGVTPEEGAKVAELSEKLKKAV